MSDEQNKSGEVGTIRHLPVGKLKEFKNHPFKIYEREQLEQLAASIKESGVLTPIIVRQKKIKRDDNPTVLLDEYEILSGHNRVAASKLAGLDTIPAEIRDVDDDRAVAIVNGTNIQQRSFEKWLPSEKAQSIAQYHESIKRQGERGDLTLDTSSEIQNKWDSMTETGKIYGVRRNIVEKYLNLNRLITQLKKRLDKKEFGEIAAMNISHLSKDGQKTVNSLLKAKSHTLTLDNSKKIRELSKAGELTADSVEAILREDTGDVKPKSYIVKSELISKYFPNAKPEEIEAELIKALELYRSQNTLEIQND